MPTEEQKRQYAANRSAKRAKDKYEALPQTRALRGEFNALKESIAGERAYMWNADYEAKLVERASSSCGVSCCSESQERARATFLGRISVR